MHGLKPEGPWSMIDQGEITDILTTHPYPLWTVYCSQDPLNTIRPVIHGTAESQYSCDLSGKPVLIEEMGSLGPMFEDNKTTADFFRTAMFSSWTNNFRSAMWWCNIDFANLSNPPYDWFTVERELGLFNTDGTHKPIVKEIQNFRDFYSIFPYKDLPKAKSDAICILTKSQDQWAVTQNAYILAKQAGLNIEFQYSSQPIKEAPVYLLPSVNYIDFISKSRMDILLKRVYNGSITGLFFIYQWTMLISRVLNHIQGSGLSLVKG